MSRYPNHADTQLPVDPSLENSFANEETRVVIYDDLAKSIINGMEFREGGYYYENLQEEAAAFFNLFELHELDKKFLASPTESFHDLIVMIRVIRRKSDGKLFGYEYDNSLGKYEDDESLFGNGEENGIEFDFPSDYDWDSRDSYHPTAFVFKPVQPFTLTGYQIAE